MSKSVFERIQECKDEWEKFLRKNPFNSLNRVAEIAKDIADRQDNAIAMEFTKTIAELLKENGIVIHCTEHSYTKDLSENSIEKVYGVIFDIVDCTEHDKKFTDRIEELEKKLERKETEINQIDNILNKLFGVTHDIVKTPDEFEKILEEKADNYKTVSDFMPKEPIKAADLIIENFKQGKYPIYERDSKGNIKHVDIDGEKYPITTGEYEMREEVRQIAEHLLVYCNHNSERNEE